MEERSNVITFKGGPMTLLGAEVKVGDPAPAFKLVGRDMAEIDSASFDGKVRVLSVAPSIDTPVCAAQTRTFNKAASDLSSDVVLSLIHI